MPTYAIGDIHGCLSEFEALLHLLDFTPKKDKLWLTGDLVNRGPYSLETLRFVRSLGSSVSLVLGNHDLNLLALQYRLNWRKNFPYLQAIFQAPDCPELLQWLRMHQLLHHDPELNFTMIHAGLPPQWDLQQAQICAKEAEAVLHSPEHALFFHHMYGEKPEQWNENLQGWERLRFIVNCFTRMRFCDKDGRLNLTCKSTIGSQPSSYMPWFKVPNRRSKDLKIIFGHWASLAGRAETPNVYALDTGCVYGGYLTALRLEDEEKFEIKGSWHHSDEIK